MRVGGGREGAAIAVGGAGAWSMAGGAWPEAIGGGGGAFFSWFSRFHVFTRRILGHVPRLGGVDFFLLWLFLFLQPRFFEAAIPLQADWRCLRVELLQVYISG